MAAETVVVNIPAKTLEWQTGEPGKMTWDEAVNYCNNLTLSGKTDWRLPNIYELQAVRDLTKFGPEADIKMFPNIYSSNYWSSTNDPQLKDCAWSVRFFYRGSASYYNKANRYYVRCVRGKQN